MATFNGFGTLHYGWKQLPDGTAEATLWVVAAFFPIVPLRRQRIRVLHAGTEDATFLIFAGHAFATKMQVLESLPVEWPSVFVTYAWGYLVVPMVLAVPFAAMILTILSLERAGMLQAGRSAAVIGIGTLACMVYWAWVVATILDRASGRRVMARVTQAGSSRDAASPVDGVLRENPTPRALDAEPAPSPSRFYRRVGWIVAGLAVLFAVTGIVQLFKGDPKVAIGGGAMAVVFGKLARDWLSGRG